MPKLKVTMAGFHWEIQLLITEAILILTQLCLIFKLDESIFQLRVIVLVFITFSFF